jgi:hypothetical protein
MQPAELRQILHAIETVGNGITVTGTDDLAKIGGNTVVTAGVNGTLAIGGNQATNSNVSTNVYPTLIAGSDYGGTPKIQNLKVDSSGNIYLAAGTNIIGKVSIDQTTPGTTNGVSIAQIGATTVTTGAGASTAGTQRVITATDSTIGTVSTLTSGNVGGFTAYVSSTITMSVAGAYATGDYMGTTTTPQSFANVVRTSGGTAIINSLTISDKITTANVAMELWLFSATFTAPTDNAAWSITDTEALTVLGVIPIITSKWYASNNNQIYFDDTISMAIKPAATSLFYALVARGTTPAFTSGDITLNLGIIQD